MLLLLAAAGAAAVARRRKARGAAERESEATPATAAPPEPSPRVRARLTLLTGPSTGTGYPVRSSTTIGRASESDIALDDRSASRRHAVLRLQEGAWVLADLGSANGTWANRARIDGPVVLAAGDIVTIGTTSFRFDLAPVAPGPVPPPVPTSPATWAPTLPTGIPRPVFCSSCGVAVKPGSGPACPACGAVAG